MRKLRLPKSSGAAFLVAIVIELPHCRYLEAGGAALGRISAHKSEMEAEA